MSLTQADYAIVTEKIYRLCVKEQILFDYFNPVPSADLYPGFDENQINVIFVGKSGTGKSSLVKTVAENLIFCHLMCSFFQIMNTFLLSGVEVLVGATETTRIPTR